jgi:hypothetical protein
MRTPDIYERVQVLEDEVKLQDSALDSRTRILWAEITKLKAALEAYRTDLTALRTYIEKGAEQHKIEEVRA